MKQAGSCEDFKVILLYTKPLSENVGYKSDILAVRGYYIIVISKIMNYIKNMYCILAGVDKVGGIIVDCVCVNSQIGRASCRERV